MRGRGFLVFACVALGAIPLRQPLNLARAEEPSRTGAAVPEEPGAPSIGHPAAPADGTREPSGNLSGRGLLAFKDLFPLALLHLQLPVDTLQLRPAGEIELAFDFGWGNSFTNRENAFFIDAETFLLEVTGWYAVTDNVYFGATLPYVIRDAGVLDTFVEGFHSVFGISNEERREASTNDYEVTIVDRDGRERSFDKGFGLGDLVLRTHWNAYRGTELLPAVAVDGLVSVPTGFDDFGGSGVDLGVALALHKTVLDRLHLHLAAGATCYSDTETNGLRYNRFGWQVSGGVEYELTPRLAFILQGIGLSPQLDFPSPLDFPRSYVGGGIKWEVADGWLIQASLMDNLVPQRNSVDVVFRLGLARRF